jgi:hypothetical protein
MKVLTGPYKPVPVVVKLHPPDSNHTTRCNWVSDCPRDKYNEHLGCDDCPAYGKMGTYTFDRAKQWWEAQ